jgi:hypothetical protein
MAGKGSEGLERTDRSRGGLGPSPAVLRRVVCLTCLVCLGADRAGAGMSLETGTGLQVTIHTAADIVESWVVERDGRTWLQHPAAGALELDRDRYRWNDLVPADPTTVADALAATRGFRTDLKVEVFLLPGFPAEILASFARRNVIFLAPGLGPQAAETIAYVATHELGHVLHWAALDGRPDRWRDYRLLRNLALDEPVGEHVPHAERHREILAEDFRYLFGGELATRSGTIENDRLPLPDRVAGLSELLTGFLADLDWQALATNTPSQVYPNPCRDLARVELLVGDRAHKTLAADPILEIFDLRGRLVRRVEGGTAVNGRVTAVWDGRLSDGRRAAGGTYLYRIQGAGHSGSGRFLLISP